MGKRYRTPEISVTETVPQDLLTLSVQDAGIGAELDYVEDFE